MLSLDALTAHLWLLWSDEVKDAALLSACHALMSPDEVAQHDRFVFASGRHEYLMTRALVRTVLSRYAAVAPRDWTFERNAYGRPSIAAPQTGLHFNLSNTAGLIACLVSTQPEIGVDVEDMDREMETVSIADNFFSPEEVRALRAEPPSRQRERFFTYWTLKESYIKARGMGLSLPLDQFTFQLNGEHIGITFDPRLVDTPDTWQFNLFRPSPRHTVATALRRGGAGAIDIQTRVTVPLQSE